MLILNLWMPEVKGILHKSYRHRYFGPINATISDGNVGHINIVYEKYSTDPQVLIDLTQSYPKLSFENTYAISLRKYTAGPEAESKSSQDNKNNIEIETETKTKGLRVTHSFWPDEKPTVKEALLSFASSSYGVTSTITTHGTDMLREGENKTEIIHSLTFKNENTESNDIKKSLEESIIKLKNDDYQIQNELKKITKEYDQLTEKSKNSKVEDPDHTDSNKLHELQKKISDLNTGREQVLFELFKIENTYVKGKNPDYSIYLPTTENNLPYHLDEKNILKEMENQREHSYNFFANNCAASVKKCLMAGISTKLKDELIKNGFNEKHFIIHKFEAPKTVLKWAAKLDSHITRLNYAIILKMLILDSQQNPTLASQAAVIYNELKKYTHKNNGKEINYGKQIILPLKIDPMHTCHLIIVTPFNNKKKVLFRIEGLPANMTLHPAIANQIHELGKKLFRTDIEVKYELHDKQPSQTHTPLKKY